MSIALIFTLDYELFGDGTGSVYREQIVPTSDLINLFDIYGAKLTIFFEYGQYTGLRMAGMTDEIAAIENQLRSAILRGHDVQLHYHPTWHKASYRDGRFFLNEAAYDISFLEEAEIERILKEGKQYLEQLLKPLDPTYSCNCYRAGAWSMSDAAKVLPIMRKLGFAADSSVAPGARFESSYGNFDFTMAPQQFKEWSIGNDLVTPDPQFAFLEVPIYTKRQSFSFLKFLNLRYLLSKRIYGKFYKTKLSEKNTGLLQKIFNVFSRDYYMADFNSLSIRELYKMVLEAAAGSRSSDSLVPVVLIGHSKFSYYNDDLIHFFESVASSNEQIEYRTLGQFVAQRVVSQ